MGNWINVNDAMPTKYGHYMCKLRAVKNVIEEEDRVCFYNIPLNGCKGYFELPLNRHDSLRVDGRVTHWREIEKDETLD